MRITGGIVDVVFIAVITTTIIIVTIIVSVITITIIVITITITINTITIEVTCGNDRLSETSISANASAMLVYLHNGSQTEQQTVAPTRQSLYSTIIAIMKTADA